MAEPCSADDTDQVAGEDGCYPEEAFIPFDAMLQEVSANGAFLGPMLWKSCDDDDEDDDDVDDFTEEEIKNDPEKRMLWAAENNQIDVACELLTSDPHLVHTRDSDLYSPLHRASYNNHCDMAKLLLSHGADIGSRTADGWQPLHSAARWNSVETAQVLIDYGAEVNAQTNGGLTPLHMAASEPNNGKMLELLLTDPCINAHIKSNTGETAKDICQRCSPHYLLFDLMEENVSHLCESPCFSCVNS